MRNGSGTFSKENGIHFCNHGSGRRVVGFLGFKIAGEIGVFYFSVLHWDKYIFFSQLYSTQFINA